MPEQECPSCGSTLFLKRRGTKPRLVQGFQVVQVQCASCGWLGSDGVASALPKYVTLTESSPEGSPYERAAQLLEAERLRLHRQGRLQRALVLVAITVLGLASLAWAASTVMRSFKGEEPSTPGRPGPLVSTPPARGTSEANVESFLLKGYEPSEGFTTTARPMRVLHAWEGTSSATQTVRLQEAPWTLFWSWQELSALGSKLEIFVTPPGTASGQPLEVWSARSGVNYMLYQEPGEYTISVEASGVRWKVWVLTEPPR